MTRKMVAEEEVPYLTLRTKVPHPFETTIVVSHIDDMEVTPVETKVTTSTLTKPSVHTN